MSQYNRVRRAIPEGASFDVWHARDGWPLRRFDWPQTGAARGSILFQTGRGDLMEKWFESLAHWHAQGWNITGFDWRGQGGSGRVLPDPLTGHIDDFKIWTRDLSDFWADWSASAPGPHIAIGHSMGGHLVLRTVLEGTIKPDKIILSAPMLGFETKMLPVSWVALAVRLVGAIAPHRPAWKSNERPSAPNVRRRSYLTHDDSRYEDELWWREQQPDHVLGPPSLGWLSAAYQSTIWTSAGKKLENLNIPTFFFGTDGDQLVSPEAIRAFAARVPGAKLFMFDEAVAHEILRETDLVRDQALAHIDAFLEGG